MNMSQLFNMFAKMVAQRAMRWGIDKGMDRLSGNRGQAPDQVQDKAARRSVQNGSMARKMRNLSRLTRR